MTAEALDPASVDDFIARWTSADGTERANYQLFALDLCELLGVAKPIPASTADGSNAYVFERNVTASFAEGSRAARFIDLYKRGCFVLEAKQSGKKLNSRGQTRTLEQAWVQLAAGGGRAAALHQTRRFVNFPREQLGNPSGRKGSALRSQRVPLSRVAKSPAVRF